MFSNPYKQAAKDFLQTADEKVREQTRQQLIHAGSDAVKPLIDALIAALIEFDSVGMSKNDMISFWEAGIEQGILGSSGKYLDMAREHIEQMRQMPDNEDGMSLAQIQLSQQAIEHTWQVIEQIGEPAIRALFTLVNGKDKRKQLASLLVLNVEAKPSRLVINLLIISVPYHKTPSGELMEGIIHWLVGRILFLNGDLNASDAIRQICRDNNITEHEFYEDIIYQGVNLIAKSKR